MEASGSIGYSKLRVAFDSEKFIKNTLNNLNVNTLSQSTPRGGSSSFHRELQMNSHSQANTPMKSISQLSFADTSISAPTLQQQVMGDISEPFWVQSTIEGSMWSDPDELCLIETKRLITLTDKRIFWEMVYIFLMLDILSL
jgi:hypothetical protein